EDISKVEEYHRLGARSISLAHNGHSQFSYPNTGEADDQWLHPARSALGRQAVGGTGRLGTSIDVSHPSKESMVQTIQLSKAPVIASHSSARALCDHSRNLDDQQLLMIKENGGVVQTVAFSAYLDTEKHEARNEYMVEASKQV